MSIDPFFLSFQFQEILKPNYNSVDLAEVELIHNYKNPQTDPRSNDTELLAVRLSGFPQMNNQYYSHIFT